jgi:hypothetical protein
MYLLSKQNGRADRLPGVRLVSYFNAGNAAGNFRGPLAPLFIGVAADRLSSALGAREYVLLELKNYTRRCFVRAWEGKPRHRKADEALSCRDDRSPHVYTRALREFALNDRGSIENNPI